MDEKKKKYLSWFILKEIPGLGNHLFKILIQRFKTPENILNASEIELRKVANLSLKSIDSIIGHKKYIDSAAGELERLSRTGIKISVLNDKTYPALLKQIPDPPAVITYRGKLDNSSPCIAIVGSRNATSYGLNSAQKLSFDLCSNGFTIVSGMARGIDAAAHRGALKYNGKTIAVLGSGLNRIYPAENKTLFDQIQKNGAVISELKLNAEPKPYHFPLRNRIIAGLSTGTIVVEAAKKSGSLITARLSAEYGREVFAVPGSIRSQKSAGTHAMLKDGAKLVENKLDVIEELHHFVQEKTSTDTLKHKPLTHTKSLNIDDNKTIDTIMKILEPYPLHIDNIIQNSNLETGVVTSALLDLELQNRVLRLQGNYFCIPEE